MGAMAIEARRADEAPGPEALFQCDGPSAQLRLNAALSPGLPAFADQIDRKGWSGREPRALSFVEADAETDRLAGFFRSLGLRDGAIVAVALPNGSEACLTIAALDRAGLTPALLSVATPGDAAAVLVESIGAAGVVTQSRIADLSPALEWRDVAAGYFGMRFPMAFGPDAPDGLIDLDDVRAAPADEGIEAPPPRGASGFISFETRDQSLRPVFRTWGSAIAAARAFLDTAGYRRGDRIVSLLAQDDFRSLTTGLVGALTAGATLVSHGLFSSRAFVESLAGQERTIVVAPGWMEADLAKLDLGPNVANVVLVHQAPVRFKARAPLTHGVIDALAFGETALLSRARGARGQFALSLDASGPVGDGQTLLEARRDETGRIFFRGAAAEASPYGERKAVPDTGEWRKTPYFAEVFAGIVIGVSEIAAI